jgi:hypothetical protein
MAGPLRDKLVLPDEIPRLLDEPLRASICKVVSVT